MKYLIAYILTYILIYYIRYNFCLFRKDICISLICIISLISAFFYFFFCWILFIKFLDYRLSISSAKEISTYSAYEGYGKIIDRDSNAARIKDSFFKKKLGDVSHSKSYFLIYNTIKYTVGGLEYKNGWTLLLIPRVGK